MRAVHNNGYARSGQAGAGFLMPHLPVVHVVERRVGRRQDAHGHWVDVWFVEGRAHATAALAGVEADSWRAQGFTVRVRPVVL